MKALVLGLLSLVFFFNTVWCGVQSYRAQGWQDNRRSGLFFGLACCNGALFIWIFSEALPEG